LEGAVKMRQTEPILRLPLRHEIVVSQVSLCLVAEGFQVTQTFELGSACASFTDNVCPHKGSSPCKCQLIVLMIYGATVHPVSLVFHGDDKETEIFLAVDLTQSRDLDFENRIQQALNKENDLFLDMVR
jgi:hypothetical protein